jgi:hypothetical protein
VIAVRQTAQMTTDLETELLRDALDGVGGDDLLLPEVVGPDDALPSHLPTREVAVACVGAAMAEAGAVLASRRGRDVSTRLDRPHVAAAVRSERSFGHAGRGSGMGFASLSRFWPTADCWLRTHANYPWHQEALLAALGVADDDAAVAAALAERPGAEVEEAVFAAGGIAGVVRTIDTWRAHAQGAAVHDEPLVAHRSVDGAPPREWSGDDGPLAGVRVLDLTRVIAGPVCTRTLGALGADVLRIDPPQRLDLRPGRVADTLFAKRSAIVDLRAADGLARVQELLADADVMVTGYRPGALAKHGLSEDAVLEHHPGIVMVVLDAWGHTGPWSGRRGFDSVVQAVTGISLAESDDGNTPGVLPCQLLDHGTGHLAAASALDALRVQRERGGTHVRRLSLARTAAWLTSRRSTSERVPATDADAPDAVLQRFDHDGRALTAVRPPGELDGRQLTWPQPLTRYGEDEPRWWIATRPVRDR